MRRRISFRGVRPLAGKSVGELLKFLVSDDPIESCVGFATANALTKNTPTTGLPGDVLDAVGLLPKDRVGMVGFFGPLIQPLKERVRLLEVFEENESLAPNLLPSSVAVKGLSECDVSLITSTAIINNTIAPLLEAASGCREVVLLGSSTPMLPEVFDDTAVTCLSGITVNDPDGMLQVISEGGGTRFFKPFVTKWNLPLKRGSEVSKTRFEHPQRALLLVADKQRATRLIECLSSKGISVVAKDNPNEAIEYCRENPPDLAVVEDNLPAMAGPRFLSELLIISWTTATILIACDNEDAVHERAEGLGILGHIRGYDDVEGLEKLVERRAWIPSESTQSNTGT
ncbi:Rossmann-like domain-containing protein [Thermodesulfobacteriota bacterium]